MSCKFESSQSVIRGAVVLSMSLFLAACSGGSVTERLAVKPDLHQLRNGDYQTINESNPGAKIELLRYVKYGKYTVFDFSSPY